MDQKIRNTSIKYFVETYDAGEDASLLHKRDSSRAIFDGKLFTKQRRIQSGPPFSTCCKLDWADIRQLEMAFRPIDRPNKIALTNCYKKKNKKGKHTFN
jgi:hypothetical protein